jgi:hypothetical protein
VSISRSLHFARCAAAVAGAATSATFRQARQSLSAAVPHTKYCTVARQRVQLMAALSKKRVAYFYDGESWSHFIFVTNISASVHSRIVTQNEYRIHKALCSHVSSAPTRRGHWQLLLWASAPNETASHSNDAQSDCKLWPVQAHGDLCTSRFRFFLRCGLDKYTTR